MIRPVLLGLALAALAGCGSDKQSGALLKQTFTALSEGFSANKSPAPKSAAEAGLTRAALSASTTPLISAAIPSRDAFALLQPFHSSGDVQTWVTGDASSISLRQGVVIATRGLGPDLMSASVPSLATLATGGGTHQRMFTLLDGADQPQRLEYSCKVTSITPESTIVVGLASATRHIVEECRGSGPAFTNHFWVEIGGKVRKSRQWIGQNIAYVDIEQLVD